MLPDFSRTQRHRAGSRRALEAVKELLGEPFSSFFKRFRFLVSYPKTLEW